MTGTPPEDREPRDDTAIMPVPDSPVAPSAAVDDPRPGQTGVAPAPPVTPAVADLVAAPPQHGTGHRFPPVSQPSPGQTQPPVHPAYQQQTVTHAYGAPVFGRPAVGGGHVAVAWVVAVLTLGYMLPWAIAATRGRPNTGAIALVNLLVGWTFIGWVAALVMACLSDPVQVASPTFVQVNSPGPTTAPPGWYPDGRGGSQYWDGRGWVSGPR